MTIAEQWRVALADVVVRHPDKRCKPFVNVTDGDPPHVHVGLDRAYDNANPNVKLRAPFAVASVALLYFPGVDLARKWLAAAWAGYLMHEALELVTVGDLVSRPLDPHEEPYVTNPYNRSLRDGFPSKLTAHSLYRTLCVVMDEDVAKRLTWGGEPNL